MGSKGTTTMGQIAAIAVGASAFFIVLSTGNAVGALLFGGAMFAMAYAAFAWRPAERQERESAQPSKPPVKREDYVPTSAEVGSILGASLVEGHDPSEIEAREFALVQAAEVSRAAYVHERFVLRACAAAYATGAYLPPNHYEAVAGGFMTWFQQSATSSDALRQALSTFQERLPVYVEAARRDGGSFKKPDALTITHVAGTFGDVMLKRSASPATAEGPCQMLAMAVADAQWSSQVEGSVMLFRRAGLLRQ